MANDNDGWDNYSKLVLQQLETVAKSLEQLRDEFQAIKDQLAQIKAKE